MSPQPTRTKPNFANEPDWEEEDKMRKDKKPRSPRDRPPTKPLAFSYEKGISEKKKIVDPAELERKKELKRIRKMRDTDKVPERDERRLKRTPPQKDMKKMKEETLQGLKDWKEIDYWKRMKKLKKKERMLEKERIAAAGAGGKDPSPRIRKDGLTIEFPPTNDSPVGSDSEWRGSSSEGITVPAVPAPLDATSITTDAAQTNGTSSEVPRGASAPEMERLDLTEENVPVAHETDDEEEKIEVQLKPRSPRRDMPMGHRYTQSLSSDKKSPRLLKREFYTSASLTLNTPSAQPPPPPPPPYPAQNAQFSQQITTYKEKKKGHYEGNFHPVHKKVPSLFFSFVRLIII